MIAPYKLPYECHICEPHQCPSVDAKGLHELSHTWSTGRSARHHSMNDLDRIARPFKGRYTGSQGAAENRKIADSQIRLIDTVVFISTNRDRNHGMGAIGLNSDDIEFLGELGRRINRITDDKRESAFLFQRMSLLIQRYKAVAIRLPTQPLRTTSSRYSISFAFSFAFNPRYLYYYRG